MCIICEMREAGASEGGLELVEVLAEFTVEVSNGLICLQAEGATLTEEERLALLALATMFGQAPGKDEPAPEGVPPEMWAGMPANLRDLIRRVTADGGKVQMLSLSDIMGGESDSLTKH